MPLITETLERTAIAPVRRRPGSAVALSLGIHVIAAAILFFVPLKIVQWSSAEQQGPFEVTLADELVSEETNREAIPEELVDEPEVKPARAAKVAAPVTPLKVLAIPGEAPELVTGQLAFVTVSEVFEPSLEFKEAEAEDEEEIAEPEISAPKSKPSPAPTKTAKKGSSANTSIVSARVIRNPSPVYPASARDKGQEGTVIFTVAISSKGSVNALQVSKSSGHSILDGAAQKAVRRWKFAPASRGGVAVASQVRVPIRFQIQ